MKYEIPKLHAFAQNVKHGGCLTGTSAAGKCTMGTAVGGSVAECANGASAYDWCHKGTGGGVSCWAGPSAQHPEVCSAGDQYVP